MKRNQLTSLKTIAESLQISQTTVSRVLSGQSEKYRISKKTASAVLELAEKLNFSPNKIGRSLRLNKTQTIGLVIPDISNPFFSTIARSIATEARKHNYSIILCDSQENTTLEIETLDLLLTQQVDGLIVLPVGQSCEHLKKFEKNAVPIVLVDRYFPDLKIPFVSSDNYKGAFEAVKYLTDNGHRSIACIQGIPGTSPNEQRVKGYCDALKAAGIDADMSLVVGDSYGHENGYINTKLLIKSQKKITAIFALSNLISLGAIRALTEENLSIPDDVSIICFDDQPYSAYLSTPISVIIQNTAEMGQIAVNLLISQLTAKKLASNGILLPTTFTPRSSVKKITNNP